VIAASSDSRQALELIDAMRRRAASYTQIRE
jgi:hypothetical protein